LSLSNKDLLIALSIITIWGINFVIIVLGIQDMPPILLGGIRFLAVAAIGSIFFKPPKTPFIWMVAYAIPISFLQFAFLFYAMSSGMPAGLASLVLQSQALFTLFFAFVFLKEGIKAYQILAILTAIAGLTFIANNQDQSTMSAIGFGLSLVSAAFWSLGNIVTRKISQKGYDNNVNLVVWSAWITVIPFFICSYLFEGPERILSSLDSFGWQTLWSIVYLSIISTIIGYGLWSYLLGRYPAGQIAPLTLGVPVVGLAAAVIVLEEVITSSQWIGILLVLMGLLINTFGGRLKRLF